MRVEVKRGEVHYFCTSPEQLKDFIDAGYAEVKEPETAKKKPTKTKE